MKDELHWADRSDLHERFDASARPIISVDVEKYQAYLDSAAMTDAQKEESGLAASVSLPGPEKETDPAAEVRGSNIDEVLSKQSIIQQQQSDFTGYSPTVDERANDQQASY